MEEAPFLLQPLVRPRLDEGRVTNRRAEHHKAALVWRLVTSPHIRSEVGHLGWCWRIGPAENPCFAVIGSDAATSFDRACHDVACYSRAGQGRQDVEVIQECENLFIRLEAALGGE